MAPSPNRSRRWLVVLGLLLSVASLIGVQHRSAKGRNALLKWEPYFLAVEQDRPIYQTNQEGYPTLPLTLMLLAPLRALGEQLGPLCWALLKVALAWWVLLEAFKLASGSVREFPPWAALVVVMLSFRVLHSDVQHGNLNLVVGASVLAGFSAWRRGWELRAGLWFGLGTVLKVTPALALVYLARKRSLRGLLGAALGLVLFVFVLPGLWLGFERNLEMSLSWWQQMISPYFTRHELTLLQTEQINQSMLGVGARLLTDSVAIKARPPVHAQDVYVNWVALDPRVFRGVHLSLCAAVLAFLLWRVRGRPDRRGLVVLGEAALVAMAMLILSERSWKQHYVLLALPLTHLAWTLARNGWGSARGRIALAALSLVGVLVGLSGDAVLGDAGADQAEAYGAWFWAAVTLMCSVGLLLPPTGDEVQEVLSSGNAPSI